MKLTRNILMEMLNVIEKVAVYLSIWSVFLSFSEAVWWHFTDPVAFGFSMKAGGIFVSSICFAPLLFCWKPIRCVQLKPVFILLLSALLPSFLVVSSMQIVQQKAWVRTGLLSFGTALSPFVVVWVLSKSPRFSKAPLVTCSSETAHIKDHTHHSTANLPSSIEHNIERRADQIFLFPGVEFLIAVLLNMTLRWCAVTINILYETWVAPLILLLCVIIFAFLRFLITTIKKRSFEEGKRSRSSTGSTTVSSDCGEKTKKVYFSKFNNSKCANNNVLLISCPRTPHFDTFIDQPTEERVLVEQHSDSSRELNSMETMSHQPCSISTNQRVVMVTCGIIEGVALGTFLALFQWIFSTPSMLCRWSRLAPYPYYGMVVLLCFAVSIIVSSFQPLKLLFAKSKQRKSSRLFQAVRGEFEATCFVGAITVMLLVAYTLQLFTSMPFFGSCIFAAVLPYCFSLNLQSIHIIVKLANSQLKTSCFMNIFPGVVALLAGFAFIFFYVLHVSFINPQLTSIFLGRMDIVLFIQFILVSLSMFAYVLLECLNWNLIEPCNNRNTNPETTQTESSSFQFSKQTLRCCQRPVVLALFCMIIVGAGASIGPIIYPQHCLLSHEQAYKDVLNFSTSINSSVFSVMSWNVLLGHDTNGRDNLPCLGGVIRHIKPDIVGLQESDALPLYWGGKDILGYLNEFLGGDIEAYSGVNPLRSSLGVGILTHFTVISHNSLILPLGVNIKGLPHYTITKVDCFLGKEKIRVINVHAVYKNWTMTENNLSPFENVSTLQMKFIADQVKDWNETQPAIIMGDFNLNPDEQQLDIFYKTLGFKSALHQDRKLSPPSTLQNRFAIVDHIFYRGLNLLESKVLNETRNMSDHSPILAYFEVPK